MIVGQPTSLDQFPPLVPEEVAAYGFFQRGWSGGAEIVPGRSWRGSA